MRWRGREGAARAGGGPTGERNGSFADGTGDAARFNHPEGAAVDSLGRLLVADTLNQRLRLVTGEGETTTYAGVYTCPVRER